MGISNFIPELWADSILIAERKALVLGSLCNNEYSGTIANYGDTVRINEIEPITISAYTRNASQTPQTLTDASKSLLIDQAYSFDFVVDDLDNVQSNPKLIAGATEDAGYRMADQIDQFIGGLYTEAGVTNTNLGTAASAVTVSAGNCIQQIARANRYLDEANAPSQGRFLVICPWWMQKLIEAGIGVAATTVPKDPRDAVRNLGYYTTFMGMEIYVSNNLSKTSATSAVKCLAGTRRAITLAVQLMKTEALRSESYFADRVRGLGLWGGKVVRPNQLALLCSTEG